MGFSSVIKRQLVYLTTCSAILTHSLICAQTHSPIYIGGYIYGAGAQGNQVNFQTCLNAGANFVDFCQFGVSSTGNLTDNTSPPTRVPDFLNGMANNPGFIANIVISANQPDTDSLIQNSSGQQANFFADLNTMVMPLIGTGMFAGLTLDFETPLFSDKTATTNLLQQIKNALLPVNGTLTVVTSAINNDATGFDIRTLWEEGVVDFFEPMMYSNISSHGQPQANYFFTLEGLLLSLNEFASHGVELDHVVPLLPFYCDQWDNIPSGNSFGLYQYGTYHGTDVTLEEIFDLIAQRPEYLHINPPGANSSTSASWVYVPGANGLGTFLDFIHPAVLVEMMDGMRRLFPGPTIMRFGFFDLNEDTPDLAGIRYITHYFPTK